MPSASQLPNGGRTRCWVPLVVALVLIATPAQTSALSCRYPGSVRPGPDDVGVPVNTRIWINDVFAGSWWEHEDFEACPLPRLFGDDGSEPELEIAPIPDDGSLPRVLVLTPTQPLKIGTEYTLEFECLGHYAMLTERTFVVSSPADHESPVVPVLDSYAVEHQRGDFETHHADLMIDSEEPFILLDRDETSSFDPQTYAGALTDMFDIDNRSPYVGQGACLWRNWNAERGSQTSIRLAAMDLAGNISEWSEPEPIDLGCGCSSSAADGGWGWLFVPLFLRRRRCHGRCA